jgi:hypothetical protein
MVRALTKGCEVTIVALRLRELPWRFVGGKPLGRIFFWRAMYLLYLDDSGSVNNPKEEYLVLGGLAIYEAQADWFTRSLDSLAETINPSDPRSVEFHASEIFARRSAPWNNYSREEAQGIIKAVLKQMSTSYSTARAFACAVHKASYPGQDHMALAFEDMCSRFDLFLNRLKRSGDRQRGLIIIDESSFETSLQKMARDFRYLGTKWGSISSLAEVPLFVNSKSSRLVQLADHIAYAVFRRYNSSDSNYMDIFASRFDEEAGVLHGLSHKQTVDPHCMCPGCLSRRIAGRV